MIATGPFGYFSGDPQTDWDPDGRTMRLLADFWYEDQNGKRWTAPMGAPIDGASIPPVFWSVIGGPYEGKYRNASVVHDTECTQPYKNPSDEVHRMFYNASRLGGVGVVKAKIMYFAVYHFGGHWTLAGGASARPAQQLSMDDVLRAIAVIERDPELPLEAVEAFTHASLISQVADDRVEALRQRFQESRRATTRTRPEPFIPD